jgi:membrane protein YqaA with SNARE-associated domain
MNAAIGGKRRGHGRAARALLGKALEAPKLIMSNGVEARVRWNPLRSLYAWVMRHAEGPNAWAALAALSFAESSFFPMPPDVMLIPMVLADRKRAFHLAAWCALWSVIGGLFGYAIGALLYNSVGHWLISAYGMGGDISAFRTAYKHYGALIVLQGITPIPYKIVTIASGFAGLSLPLFIALSAVTRGFRFTIVSALLYWFGEPMRALIEKYLELVVIGFLVIVVAGYVLARHLF